ncbi:MAG: hypothetical protein LBT40_01840 [Deltaproteobacteria bacterium]|jgi:hypothetical protein|nr:hypothetical protein [Deltaproteobacteria bacterium]
MSLPKNIGGRVFFLLAGVLTEGDLGAEEIARATEVVQFSPDYFALANEIPPDCLGWLSQPKSLVFRWKGKTYKVLPKVARGTA